MQWTDKGCKTDFLMLLFVTLSKVNISVFHTAYLFKAEWCNGEGKKKEKHKKLDFVQTELQFRSFVFLYSRTTACFHLSGVWFFSVQFCNMLCQSINGHSQEYYYGQSVKVLAAESVKSIYSHQFICFLVDHHMDGQVRTCAEEAAIQLFVPSPAALAAEGHSGSGWD